MPRRVVEVPAGDANDGWIWGSTRGGGGAPLRDPSGHTLANLRAVVRGDVEVDHLPADSPVRRGGGRDDDNNSKSFRSRGVDDDLDYNYDDEAPRRRGGGGRKSVGYADEDDHEGDGRRGGGRGSGRGGGGSGRRRDDYDEYEPDVGGYDRDAGKRRDRERDRDRDRDRARVRSPVDTHVPHKGLVAASSSPKKFMNSIKVMNNSASAEEQAARARKELDYQSQLREQIEEKRRKKEDEERKAEETKRKELEEYLALHYKGKIPQHVLDKLPSKSKSLAKGGRAGNDESIYNVGRKAASFDDDVGGDDDYDSSALRNRGAKNRQGSGEKPPRHLRLDDEDGLSLELVDYDGGGARSGRAAAPRRRRKDDDGGSPSRDKWVSQHEYDELSALCDKLLVQQDTLQSELRNQAKLLKTIKVAGATSAPIRARSVQNGAKRAVPTSGPASTSKAASMGLGGARPNSIHLPSRNPGPAASSAAPPKVAFGRSTLGDADNKSAPESQQRKLMRAGGAATGKLLMKADAKIAASVRGRGPSPAPLRPSARDSSPAVQGFGRLQQVAAKSGPLIVSYDEEGRELRGGGGGGGGGRGNAARSQELSGESEYLRIAGEEVDIISGDQLDRLLAQARKARSGR